jgi:hypothetical protein
VSNLAKLLSEQLLLPQPSSIQLLCRSFHPRESKKDTADWIKACCCFRLTSLKKTSNTVPVPLSVPVYRYIEIIRAVDPDPNWIRIQ